MASAFCLIVLTDGRMAAACEAKDGLRCVRPDPPALSRHCGNDCRLYDRDGNRLAATGDVIAATHSEGLVVVGAGRKRGFVDDKGHWAIEARFDGADAFCEGLAPVRDPVGGAWGFIDHHGGFAVPPRFEAAGPFTEGLAPVRAGGKWGFVDHDGRFLVAPSFDDADLFSERLAAVRVGSKWGFIDKRGVLTIAARFDTAGPFHDGVALITRREATPKKLFGGLELAGYRGVIDRQGRIVVPAVYESVTRVSGDIVAAGSLIRFDPETAESSERVSLLKTDGALLTRQTFSTVGLLGEGLIPVCRNGRCGYLDTAGHIVFPLRFSQARDFAEGRGGVVFDGRGTFIDRMGHLVVPGPAGRQRLAIDTGGSRRFGDGLAPASCHRHWGYLDRLGRWAVKPVFAAASEIEDGIATVGLKSRTGHIAARTRRPIDFTPDDIAWQPPSLPLCGAPIAERSRGQSLRLVGSRPLAVRRGQTTPLGPWFPLPPPESRS